MLVIAVIMPSLHLVAMAVHMIRMEIAAVCLAYLFISEREMDVKQIFGATVQRLCVRCK